MILCIVICPATRASLLVNNKTPLRHQQNSDIYIFTDNTTALRYIVTQYLQVDFIVKLV